MRGMIDKKETRKTCIDADEIELRLNSNLGVEVCAGRVTALLICKPIIFIVSLLLI